MFHRTMQYFLHNYNFYSPVSVLFEHMYLHSRSSDDKNVRF